MQYKSMNLCDFCFEPMGFGDVCPKCGLTHESYHAEPGLLEPGTNLMGKYIIGRVLGRGGFGATYLAYSSERDEVVAIKEYYPTGIANRAKGEEKISIVSDDKRKIFDKGAKRLFEEAGTMAKFNTNKNVVSVYEIFYANDTVYYSMEYLEGIDLKGYIARKGGRLSEAEAVAVMRGICEALIVVHSTLTLHRDISPDNVFICTNGTVKLIDFGAAKQVIGDSHQVYSVVIKQGFAPLEQYKSTGNQGVWTDIYAVGASLYYAVTGRIPPDAMSRIENPEINFDNSLGLSPKFKEVIKKCLQNKIEDRYQSAIELMGALDELGVPNVKIGGAEYVQTIYKGVSSGLKGDAVSFMGTYGANNGGVNVHTGYNFYGQSGYLQSQQYPPSVYPPSQYQMKKYAESKENSGIVKGLIIGAAALIIVVLLIVLVMNLMRPQPMPQPGPQPMGPPPMEQPMEQSPMPPGTPMR